MKRRSSETWITVGVLALLVIVTVVSAVLSREEEPLPPLHSRSSLPDGSKALFDWLGSAGFSVDNRSGSEFVIPEGTDVVFILEPFAVPLIEQEEFARLDEFVSQGGVLIAAGMDVGSTRVFGHYGFKLMRQGSETSPVPFTPRLNAPDLSAAGQVESDFYLFRAAQDYLPLLAVKDGPYAVSKTREAGRVILVADGQLFSNQGLKQDGAPERLLNLLAPLKPGARVWVDEWHHGDRQLVVERSGPQSWLLYQPVGQAFLWLLVLAFIALALSGRRFGQPVPLPKDLVRRAPLEYVDALAGLNRRAGHRAAILRAYHRQLKRGLGSRYRLDPNLSDEEYARRLAELRPDVDAGKLLALLNGLKQGRASEAEMVELAHQAAIWMLKIES